MGKNPKIFHITSVMCEKPTNLFDFKFAFGENPTKISFPIDYKAKIYKKCHLLQPLDENLLKL